MPMRSVTRIPELLHKSYVTVLEKNFVKEELNCFQVVFIIYHIVVRKYETLL